MASELVQRFRNDVAPRLLDKFSNGGVSTVVEVVTPNPDPLMPPSIASTSTEFNASVRGVSSQFVAADPNLVVGDLQAICAAVDYVPAVGAAVRINSKDMRVIRVDPIPAAGDPAVYRFFLR